MTVDPAHGGRPAVTAGAPLRLASQRLREPEPWKSGLAIELSRGGFSCRLVTGDRDLHDSVQAFMKRRMAPYYDMRGRTDVQCDVILSLERVSHCAPPDALLAGEHLGIVENQADERKHVVGKVVRHGPVAWIWIDRFGTQLVVDHDVRRVSLVAGSSEALGLASRLVIRDLANIILMRQGYVEVHASAVGNPDGGVTAICGPSNSGKTSLLFHLVRSGGRSLVSNGRVYVAEREDGQLHAIGTPESIYVRPVTAQAFPEFQDLVLDVPQDDLNHSDCAPRKKVKTQYAEICSRLGVGITTDGPLRGIILPRLSVRGRAVHEVPAVDRILSESVFSYDAIKRREWLGLTRIPRALYDNRSRAIIERLVAMDHAHAWCSSSGTYHVKAIGATHG